MKVGEKFDIKGYELEATMFYAEEAGVVVVVHNNSSHYLIASRDLHNPPTDDIYKLEAKIPYGENDAAQVHAEALALAAHIAGRR